MNPSDPRNSLPPPPPLYTATTSSSPGRQDFVNPGIQSIPPMGTYSPPQGYGHIPLNPMPGPPYHKIAQPMQPRESIQSQQSVFQQYNPQQSYAQTHYNQTAYPEQYYPQAGYQQPTYRSPVHSMPQQYLSQHMSYQHASPTQPQPQLNPQSYDPYGRSYLSSNQGTPPGITIPQPQHPLSTNTAFSQVQPQASPSPIQPSGSPLGSFQQRQTASPSRVLAIATSSSSSTASSLDSKVSNSNLGAPDTPSSDKLPSDKPASIVNAQDKPTETVKGEVRKAMQDTAQQTDKEQKIQKVKNEAVVPRPVAATKPMTVAQKKENAKASRAPPVATIPGAPKQPPGYHDEKPCEWLVGDLVWSKVSGHPWWPCMVAYDPNLGIYTKMQGGIGRGFRMYHVQFFGEIPERGWVSGSRIRKFEGRNQYEELVTEMMRNMKKKDKAQLQAKLAVKGSRKAAWEVGVQECLKALPMSRHERKLNFTFKYDMTKNKGGATNSGEIDIVSFGDHPKMKAKRAYKKQKDDNTQEDAGEEGGDKKAKGSREPKKGNLEKRRKDKVKEKENKKETPKKKKKNAAEDPRSLRKRGRKSSQFLKFCTEREEALKKENSLLSKRDLYSTLDKEWSEMSNEDKAKYETEVASTPRKSDRKRKCEASTPSTEPVLKRSKREAKPSRKIQESELSNLNFAKRGLKFKDSSELPGDQHDKDEATEKADAEKVTSPPERPKKPERKDKSASPPKPVSSKRGRKIRKPSTEHQLTSSQTDSGIEATKQSSRKKPRKSSLADEMSKDFEEMQEDAPLVIDTSAIASVLEDPPETPGLAEKATGSRRTSTSTTTGKESLRRSTRSRNKSSSNTVTGSG